MSARVPTAPLSVWQSLGYGFGNLGAQSVYAFLNRAVGLHLNRYPEVPTWAVGVLAQERSLAGAVVQPVVGAMSDRTRTRIGRRRPYFIAGAGLTAAALLHRQPPRPARQPLRLNVGGYVGDLLEHRELVK